MGPTIQILKKAPFSWFWWSVSLQLTRYHCRFGRNFYLFLCGNYSGVCQSLFTQSQVIPSGENQQINWCCHTGKSNWFLKNIRNFRQGCHLAGTKRPKLYCSQRCWCSATLCKIPEGSPLFQNWVKMATICRGSFVLRSLVRRAVFCRLYSSKFVQLILKKFLLQFRLPKL